MKKIHNVMQCVNIKSASTLTSKVSNNVPYTQKKEYQIIFLSSESVFFKTNYLENNLIRTNAMFQTHT